MILIQSTPATPKNTKYKVHLRRINYPNFKPQIITDNIMGKIGRIDRFAQF